MIQDIGVEQLKNEYHPKPPKNESRIMIFDSGKLLCRINEEMQIAYPKYSEWRKNKADERCSVYVEHFLSVSDLQESVPIICIPGMKTIIFAENAEQNS